MEQFDSAAPEIDGLSYEAGGTSIKVRFDNPPRGSFFALVKWLPEGAELRFYDQYYPSMSDPGGYVSVQRSGNVAVYMVGNHGWSTNWLKQSPQLIAAWLDLNLVPLGPFSPSFNHVDIVKASSDPWV